jgi:hypothetical protein
MSRRVHSVILTVSAPSGLAKAQLMREIKCRINEVAGYFNEGHLDLPENAYDKHGQIRLKATGNRRATL